MAIFTKAILGSAVAGTIALGAMVTYDGGSTVDLAKTKITEAGQQIGVFKSNETKLVGKVNLLKGEKATLTAEVAELKVQLQAEKDKNVTDNERINQLETEIAAKVAEIAELTAEIATLTADLENATGNTAEVVERINALEAELNAANEQAEELQYTLDETVFATPDQTAVDAALSPEPGTPVIDDGGETGDLPVPTNYTKVGMISDVPWTITPGMTVNTEEDGTVTITSINTTYTANVNGQTFTILDNGEPVAIGNKADLHQEKLDLTASGKTSYYIWLTNN